MTGQDIAQTERQSKHFHYESRARALEAELRDLRRCIENRLGTIAAELGELSGINKRGRWHCACCGCGNG
jgi:hypothetical protein